jgi:hypothetical protein
MKKRNLAAYQLRTNGAFKPKRAKSTEEREDQRDQWSRNGKYKNRGEAMDESYQIGDTVKLKNGKEGMIKNPNGPLNMLGISVDGKYGLIDEDDIECLAECFARLHELSK